MELTFAPSEIRRELRQVDVGRLAKMSRAVVSRMERGRLDNIQVGDLDTAAAALGATVDIRLRWRGEQLDRLIDEGHARIVDGTVRLLRGAGWDVAIEVSFSIWGERGSIDVLAHHRATGCLLVVEVKSAIPDSQAMLHDLDRKTRLAPEIVGDRGWTVRDVARLLVVGESATSRRRVERLASTFTVAFPVRGWEVRRWLRNPSGPMSGLMLLSYAPEGSTTKATVARERVRKRPSKRRQAPLSSPAPRQNG